MRARALVAQPACRAAAWSRCAPARVNPTLPYTDRRKPGRQVQLKDTKSVVGRLRLVLRLLLHLLATFFYLVIFEARPRLLRRGNMTG